MNRTLYKTKDPKTFEEGEYYHPEFEFEFIEGRHVYFVRETHGFWNDTEKRLAHKTDTLSPEEGYANYEEARARYELQVQRRIKDGFVHSYSIDQTQPYGKHIVYEFLG